MFLKLSSDLNNLIVTFLVAPSSLNVCNNVFEIVVATFDRSSLINKSQTSQKYTSTEVSEKCLKIL